MPQALVYFFPKNQFKELFLYHNTHAQLYFIDPIQKHRFPVFLFFHSLTSSTAIEGSIPNFSFQEPRAISSEQRPSVEHVPQILRHHHACRHISASVSGFVCGIFCILYRRAGKGVFVGVRGYPFCSCVTPLAPRPTASIRMMRSLSMSGKN